MKTAICHYSYHRTFKNENWSLKKLVDCMEEQGVDGIDFHVRFLPPPEEAADAVLKALEGSKLELSGLSLSTNFNHDDPKAIRDEIDTAARWLEVAAAIKAPVSRVFGGHIKDRSDTAELEKSMARMKKALGELTSVASEKEVVLALENHGGIPGTGEEQVEIIEQINSPFLRATVDVGNYMASSQDPVEGTTVAAKYCAYVHLKDNRIVPEGGFEPAVLGEGDVDLPGCLKVLKDSGYDGFVALEYEAEEDELAGVARSVAYMKKIVS